jgi:CheY-like chemotaxis protein
VVDDEPDVLHLMARALQEAGYQVYPAHSAPQALTLAANLPSPPAALVTDLKMAPVGGVLLSSLLRHIYADIRVVFVSGAST